MINIFIVFTKQNPKQIWCVVFAVEICCCKFATDAAEKSRKNGVSFLFLRADAGGLNWIYSF